MAALVVFDGFARVFVGQNVGREPLLLQCIAIRVSSIATISEQSSGLGELVKQGGGTKVIADVACDDEVARFATLRVLHGRSLVFMPPIVPPSGVPHPIFTVRLAAVRCAVK